MLNNQYANVTGVFLSSKLSCLCVRKLITRPNVMCAPSNIRTHTHTLTPKPTVNKQKTLCSAQPPPPSTGTGPMVSRSHSVCENCIIYAEASHLNFFFHRLCGAEWCPWCRWIFTAQNSPIGRHRRCRCEPFVRHTHTHTLKPTTTQPRRIAYRHAASSQMEMAKWVELSRIYFIYINTPDPAGVQGRNVRIQCIIHG